MKLHDIVEVLWEDAVAGGDSWVSPDKVKYIPHIQKTIGFFLRRDKNVLILFQTWDKEQEMVGETILIPAAMIRKVTRLK